VALIGELLKAQDGLGACYCKQGDFSKAAKVYLDAVSALENYTKTNNSAPLSLSHQYISIIIALTYCYLWTGNQPLALHYYNIMRESKNIGLISPEQQLQLVRLGEDLAHAKSDTEQGISKSNEEAGEERTEGHEWLNLYQKAERALLDGDKEQSRRMYLAALKIAMSQPSGDKRRLSTYTSLASVYRRMGKHKEAHALLSRAASESEQINSPATTEILFNLAQVCKEESDYGAAQALYNKVITAKNQGHKVDTELIASLLNSAAIYWNLKLPEKSLERYRQALVCEQSVFGMNSREYFNTLDLMLGLYELAGFSTYGKDFIETCDRLQRIQSSDSLPRARTLLRMARYHYFFAKSDLPRAEQFYRQAIAIIEQDKTEASSLKTAQVYMEFGDVLQRQKKFSEALAAHKRTMEIETKLLAQDDVRIFEAIRGLFGDYGGLKDWNTNVALMTSEWGKRESHVPRMPPEFTQLQVFLARSLMTQGKYAEAVSIFKKCLAIENLYGNNADRRLAILRPLARTWLALGDTAQATTACDQAIVACNRGLVMCTNDQQRTNHKEVLQQLGDLKQRISALAKTGSEPDTHK
jgi:tetratricopeptide (TPR) repeat protein